jgi:hypothetical protein
MRLLLTGMVCAFALGTTALVQAQQADKAGPETPHGTGRTVSPETKGQQQPQGQTGPLETRTGGAPAESPQGQTPPGMQAAPDGSSKTIVDPPSNAQAADGTKTAKDPVPPATDKSESTRAGTQEPSSKVQGTSKDENSSFEKGKLVAPGAPPDVDTAPAKYSARTNADDALPIAAYTLKHLTDDQRRQIFATAYNKEGAQKPATPVDADATVGAIVPTAIALGGLKPLPGAISASIPELRAVMFTTAGEKIVLINPRTRVVIGVLGPS